jgi:hypothetical protein
MRRSLPLLFELVLILWALTFVSLAFFRETLPLDRDTKTPAAFAQLRSTTPGEESAQIRVSYSADAGKSLNLAAFAKELLRRLNRFQTETMSGFMTRNLKVCLLIFCLKRLAFTSENFVFQYASKVLHWKFEKTSWIQFTHSLAAIIITAVLLPSVNTYLQRKRGAISTAVDVVITRGSLLVAVVGCTLLWKATNPAAMISGMRPYP